MMNEIQTIANMYGINMNVELVSGVEYDGITELEDGVYTIRVNESANDETWTHELGHVIINEMNIRHPNRLMDISIVIGVRNDEVLADIVGNLVYQYEFGETPRDMTYIFGSESELNNVVDGIVDVFGQLVSY